MRGMMLAVLGLALWAGPLVAQGGEQGPPDGMHRRAQLEQQVRRQFMEQVSRRLELAPEQRERMAAILRTGAEARRQLAEQSRGVRRDLMQVVRRNDATMETYERLLERMEALREAERAIERREEARLAEVLDPRQRVLFLAMRMQFNERIRGMRGGGGPPGGAGGPGGDHPGGPPGPR